MINTACCHKEWSVWSKQKCLLHLSLWFSTHYFNLVNWPFSSASAERWVCISKCWTIHCDAVQYLTLENSLNYLSSKCSFLLWPEGGSCGRLKGNFGHLKCHHAVLSFFLVLNEFRQPCEQSQMFCSGKCDFFFSFFWMTSKSFHTS